MSSSLVKETPGAMFTFLNVGIAGGVFNIDMIASVENDIAQFFVNTGCASLTSCLVINFH